MLPIGQEQIFQSGTYLIQTKTGIGTKMFATHVQVLPNGKLSIDCNNQQVTHISLNPVLGWTS